MVNSQYPNHEYIWLAIAIGNTRIRAAVFQAGKYVANYAYQLKELAQLEQKLATWSPWHKVAIASVVPHVVTPWHALPQAQIITTANIPIAKLYSTMGVDRALNLWGASKIYGCPVLVIDAGTALTVSGLDRNWQFAGGAILPGLNMQLRSLNTSTAALPLVELPPNLGDRLPQRWADFTTGAIQSGVIYSALASIESFIKDWLQQFPESNILITGGDAPALHRHLPTQVICDRELMFWGMRSFLER